MLEKDKPAKICWNIALFVSKIYWLLTKLLSPNIKVTLLEVIESAESVNERPRATSKSCTHGAHVCWLRNISVKVELLSALQKPSSAKKMLIQDVRPKWRIDIKPNGSEPETEDTAGQLAHGLALPLRRSGTGRAERKLKRYYVAGLWPWTAHA